MRQQRSVLIQVLALAAAAAAAAALAALGASPRLMPAIPTRVHVEPAIPRAARPDARTGPRRCDPGSRLAYRLTDLVDRAERDQPDLKTAYRRLGGFWRRNVDPYSGLGGGLSLVRQMVAFAQPDVQRFGRGIRPGRAPADPGPGQGVAVAHLSLFMPAPSTLTYAVTLGSDSTTRAVDGPKARIVMAAQLGVIRSGPQGPVTFTVSATADRGTEEVLQVRRVESNQRNVWFPVEVDLTRYAGKPVRLRLKTNGPAMAGAVVGQPEIWIEGSCRAGPNMLLVIIDTLRADGVGAISGRADITPVLDGLSRKGALFSRCFAAATWTRPSMTALLASEYPSRLGLPRVGFKLKPGARQRIYGLLRERLSTVHLKQLGYRTAAIGNNFFFLGHSSIGLDRGFDEVIDIRHPTLDTEAITETVNRFFKRNTDRPFFLWVHLDGPHWPYSPPPGYAVKGARAPGAPGDRQFEAYLGEARWADKHVQRILETLKRLDLERRTLIAATSDHGEIFSDAHTYDMSGHITRHRHGWSIYDEVLHVPLIVAGPGVGARRIQQPVSHLDLVPTLLDLAALPPLRTARGRSLAAWIRSRGHPTGRPRSAPEERPVVAEGRRQEAIRYKGLKYIRRRGFAASFTFKGARRHVTEELYDLKADPSETRNLADSRPADASKLNALLDRLLKQQSVAPVRIGAHGSPAREPGSGSRVLYIRLWAGTQKAAPRHLKATLEADASMAVAALSGPNATARWVDTAATRLELSLKAQSGELAQAGVRLPPGSVQFRLEMDGRPVQPEEILAGPFGLGLIRKPGPLTTGLLKMLAARKPPAPPHSESPRCSVWTSVGAGPVHVPIEAPEDASAAPEREVDQLLRGWGYIKGRPRKKGR